MRPAATPTPEQPSEPLVLTFFFYWYDAETGSHLSERHGLRHHLPTEPAPSWRSVDWYEKELRDMAYAGIDVALAVYWGPDRPGDEWSPGGLKPMAEARRRLVDERVAAPTIGLFLDTTAVDSRDLTTPTGKAFFYEMFSSFYRRVPRTDWALVDGQPIVFLFTSDYTRAMNQSTFDHVYDEFENEFGVRPYIVREVSWDYPILRWEEGKRVWDHANPIHTENSYLWASSIHGYHDRGGVASVGPGYDDHLVPGRGKGQLRDREGGSFYRRSFMAAIESKKPLLVIETWNEIHEGSGISETKEFGRQYLDLTRELTTMFRAATGEARREVNPAP